MRCGDTPLAVHLRQQHHSFAAAVVAAFAKRIDQRLRAIFIEANVREVDVARCAGIFLVEALPGFVHIRFGENRAAFRLANQNVLGRQGEFCFDGAAGARFALEVGNSFCAELGQFAGQAVQALLPRAFAFRIVADRDAARDVVVNDQYLRTVYVERLKQGGVDGVFFVVNGGSWFGSGRRHRFFLGLARCRKNQTGHYSYYQHCL